MNRFASTRSENRAVQPSPGRAQSSVGSIEAEGIRYGFTTHCLIASTIATAPTIVIAQSTATRHGLGSLSVRRSTGFLIPGRLAEADSPRREVDREDLPDQVAARQGAPHPRVARLCAVVAHDEVAVVRNLQRRPRVDVAPVRLHIRLVPPLGVDVDEAAAPLPHIAREADDALDEGAAGAAVLARPLRRREDDDVSPFGIAEVVDEPVREHAVGEARRAAEPGSGAMERRLHRRGRDPVRVHDPLLDRQHDRDGADDRHHPVDRDPPRAREAVGQLVDGIPHAAPAERSRLCSRRHSAIRAWSPESRISGTAQPRNSAGRVYCGYSKPPSSSAENVSSAPEPSLSAPGRRRATASATTIAGSSPPESTYGPIEIASFARCARMRSSKPSNRADSRVRCSSPASSSTTPWSSWRPCGVRATTRCSGSPPYTPSSAAATTSTRMTIPGPPPYGSSSTSPTGAQSR